nr:ABC transporter G family member 3-like [Tanacetum cinerariifolium]
ARVGAIFLFISFSSLLSIVGIPAQLKEVKVYASEDSNKHSGAFVFLTSQFFASIPFLFLISISSSLLFCFLMGLRNEFSYLMASVGFCHHFTRYVLEYLIAGIYARDDDAFSWLF